MVVCKRKTTLRSLTAKLLVMGDKRVGKSASIVRYTTGRYIENYCPSTSDWLYRHPLGFDAKQNIATTVELLEQKDVHFSTSNNLLAHSSNNLNNNNITGNSQIQQQSLADRVALDQQIDAELYEKQQLLNKLQWANAYVVIYAINDVSTFNKAIKYLNLIANNINSPMDNLQRDSANRNSIGNISINSVGSNNSSTNYDTNSNNTSKGSKFLNRLSPNSTQSGNNAAAQSVNASSSPNHCRNCPSSNGILVKRPILLVGNKCDLEKTSRQVNTSDGRRLAMRHQSMFAEISIADTNKSIESLVTSFVGQMDQTSLHVDHLNSQQILTLPHESTIGQWEPTVALRQAAVSLTVPVWGSLVKSKPVGSQLVQSSKVIGASRPENDVRLLTPISLSNSEAKCVRKALMSSALTSGNTDELPTGLEPAPDQTSKSPVYAHNLAPQSRYESLKASFRKASMAIYSTRSLTKGPKCARPDSQDELGLGNKRSSIGELQLVAANTGQEPVQSSRVAHKTGWLRGHIKLSRGSTSSISDPPTEGPQSTGARKSLFKYKSRRRTVAFEQITGSKDSEPLPAKAFTMTDVATGGSRKLDAIVTSETCPSWAYNATRCSSGRSSSSLSTSETFYISPTISPGGENQERAISSTSSASAASSAFSGAQMKTIARGNSRSTLSRTSTSGASYEDSGDENSASTLGCRAAVDYAAISWSPDQATAAASQLPPQSGGVKRHQIVKSVQSTLTNLTKSSGSTAQMAKRSLCKSLYRYPTNPSNPVTVRASVPLVVARVEQVLKAPIVGFCK